MLQLLLAGVAQGCVYALVALGFVLIYKATETVNFAQGDLMMLGGFFALTASVIMGWPYWATILFAVAAMAAVGMLIERVVLRPVLGQPAFTVVMITIGVGYVLRGVVTMIPGWGTDTYTFPTPFADGTFKVGEVIFAEQQVAVIVLDQETPVWEKYKFREYAPKVYAHIVSAYRPVDSQDRRQARVFVRAVP